MKEDDIVFEEDQDDSVNNADAKKAVQKLKEKIKKLESEKSEYLSGWQKARADFVNLRKKDEEDKKNFAKYATEDVLADLIPVLDSFDMAFANKEAWEKVDPSWRKGVEYIRDQLRAVLSEHNLKDINPEIGSDFDVHTSEAVKHSVTDDKKKDNTVSEVTKRGYMLGEKMIRPAQVVIAQFQEKK